MCYTFLGDYMNIRKELFKNQDKAYADFHSKLVPAIDKNLIIGVRMPVLRKIAKQAVKEGVLLEDSYYYEEKMLAGLMAGYKKCSIEEHLEDLRKFIPLIDNWAVCDCACSTFKFVEKNPQIYWDFIIQYLGKSEYETRFAVVMMMDYYINDEYVDKALEIMTQIKTDEYYVNMAIAWALSVAYIKYEDKALDILKNKTLDAFVHNKAIQKIRESYRVDKAKKDYLKTLKI